MKAYEARRTELPSMSITYADIGGSLKRSHLW